MGELVVEAIKADRPYVLTDRAGLGLITARTEAILAAMPATDPAAEGFTGFGS
ncbi:hypothetical protein ACIBP6_03125 [Nonomuraea terrae]|uniref:hypothetical protein n=1 Tax=Nonomuraea terrae TaxID=2530383 RepID=UPI003787326B